MTQDFKPIFDYLDEMKAELKADIKTEIIAELSPKIDKLQTSVDNLTYMVKGFQEEMIVNRHRIDRLEQWARQVSEKTGIPLPF